MQSDTKLPDVARKRGAPPPDGLLFRVMDPVRLNCRIEVHQIALPDDAPVQAATWTWRAVMPDGDVVQSHLRWAKPADLMAYLKRTFVAAPISIVLPEGAPCPRS